MTKEEIDYYIKIYDEQINFIDLYSILLPERDGTFPALCPLHEDTNPSFSYIPALNHWQCFGACAEGGGPVKFYRRFLEKELGQKVSYMYVLKHLRTILPYLPKIEKTQEQQNKIQEEKLIKLNNINYIRYITPTEIKKKDINEVFLNIFLFNTRTFNENNDNREEVPNED